MRATLGQRQIGQSPGLALNAHSGNEWAKIPVLTGLREKNLSNIHKWWLEWDSNLRPYVRKSPNPMTEPSRPSFVSFLTIMIHLGKSCPNILPRTISADTVNTSNTETHRPTVRNSR